MKEILSEIVPLSQSDCFYIVERRKSSFNYPIHRHKEMELNLVQGAPGAQRVIGDSVETIGDIDMVLTGPDLEHAWNQGNCKSKNIHEITVQFDSSLFPDSLLARNQFASIRDMLLKIHPHKPISPTSAYCGLCQVIILCTWAQIFKATFYSFISHTGNPKPFKWLSTTTLLIYKTEYQFTFSTSISSIYQTINVVSVKKPGKGCNM